jgi:chemotaxis protein methyltransferase CheR
LTGVWLETVIKLGVSDYDTLDDISLKDYRMEYKEFLKTTLPHLGLRWRRFRGKSIRKRIVGRMQELDLQSWSRYASRLLENEDERDYLTALLTITISRFWRNAQLFEDLEKRWLPRMLEGLETGEPLQIWSSGCASGEEPYSLLILWQESFANSGHDLHLLASDVDKRCLERALRGCYPASSFREMPKPLREKYCTNEGSTFCLPEDFPKQVSWFEHNLISDPPFTGNHIVLCRNLAYTYFTDSLQERITDRLHRALLPGGLLVLGRKDNLPEGSDGLFRRLQHPVYEQLPNDI